MEECADYCVNGSCDRCQLARWIRIAMSRCNCVQDNLQFCETCLEGRAILKDSAAGRRK